MVSFEVFARTDAVAVVAFPLAIAANDADFSINEAWQVVRATRSLKQATSHDVGSALELAKDGLFLHCTGLSALHPPLLAIIPLSVVLYYSKMGSHYSLAAASSFGIALAPNANIISGFPFPSPIQEMCAPFACLLLPSRACDVVVVPLSSSTTRILASMDSSKF